MSSLTQKTNPLAFVAFDSIERVRSIGNTYLDIDLPDEGSARVLEELACHEQTLIVAFEQRKKWGPKPTITDSEAYFLEKLNGLLSFVRMALLPTERGSFDKSQILNNIDHYSHSVARMVGAKWTSRSKKPATDKALRDDSFTNREALKRLADR